MPAIAESAEEIRLCERTPVAPCHCEIWTRGKRRDCAELPLSRKFLSVALQVLEKISSQMLIRPVQTETGRYLTGTLHRSPGKRA